MAIRRYDLSIVLVLATRPVLGRIFFILSGGFLRDS